MKIIHCADLHLGSKIRAKLPEEKAEKRRAEVRAAFDKMLRFAEENGVRAVLISGDAFDGDRPSLQDKRAFYDSIRAHGDIDFYYLRGNHDAGEGNGYSEELPNLKTFGSKWTTYPLGEGIFVTGAEYSVEPPYQELCLDARATNLVMLHGDVASEIDLSRLSGKHVDYLALGHIHTASIAALDERGKYAYSGCLEGRGFDECGKKGFILLDVKEEPIENGQIVRGRVDARFIVNSLREITEYRVDVSAAKDDYEAARIAESAVTSPEKDLVRVYLTGETHLDRRAIERTVREKLERRYFFASVKDETRARCDYSAYETENSLKGEFVRCVKEQNDLTAEEKDAAIRLGIGALERGEAEL